MKDVYVLYGRIVFHEGVFDHDGNYFQESPVLEVYERFDDAWKKLQMYAVEAYENLKQYGRGVVNGRWFTETTADDVLDDYNRASDSDIERDVCWTYDGFLANGTIDWQMEAFNVPRGENTPILPSLHIRKKTVWE